MVKKRKKEGWIVHPNWTYGGYGASFSPDFNKSRKKFKTLKAAKDYLRKNNVTFGMYKSSTGHARTFSLV
jgi:hypothetical protein